MTGMSVSFGGLTVDQARRLTDLYETLIGSGAPVSYAVNEYDAARALVEQQPAPASAAPVAAPAAQHAAPDVDHTGVPYHPDYHTSTRVVTAKGEWKLRKGVNKDAAEAWRRQHTGKQSAASAPAAAPVPVAPVAPPVMPSAPGTATPVYIPDYGTWYTAFGAAHASGKITEAVMNQINATAGVPDASHYIGNDQARAISYPMLQQLAA